MPCKFMMRSNEGRRRGMTRRLSFSTCYRLLSGFSPRSEADRSSAGTPVLRFSMPVVEAPRLLLFEAVRRFLSVSVEEAPVPMAVLLPLRPAVEPPAARLEEVPLLDPAEEAPVPKAVL